MQPRPVRALVPQRIQERPPHYIGNIDNSRSTLIRMLRSHKEAMAAIKSAQQRVEKAIRERDKAKEKLKKAQTRLAVEREQLRKSQDKLES